jgi:hypothetical protein
MIKKTHTFALLTAITLLPACSSLDRLGSIASCPGWVPEDRTCDVSQVPEYRSDSLGPNPVIIIKE